MPRNAIFECKECSLPLTISVTEIGTDELREVDGEPMIAEGYFCVSDGEFFIGTEGQPIVAPNSARNIQNNTIGGRLNGCCGLDGTDGMNQVCINGHEVGMLRSDCWHPHCVHFDTDRTRRRAPE
jgi:hypothetical protein